MKLTTRSRLAALFLASLLIATTAMPAFAASVRVRCEIRSSRLRIQIDGIGMTVGQRYYAVVRNSKTGAVIETEEGKRRAATVPNIDLDFDTTADSTDFDSFVPADFAIRGQKLEVVIKNAVTHVKAAPLQSATCTAKK